MIEINRTKCVKCGACVRDCIVEVLKFGPVEKLQCSLPAGGRREARCKGANAVR